ncbi:hypothetical protein BC828DRAFT_382872 [Blastocladiella britannica]|nr:hypothetical protein BC828DRAFT_382872 [Blastocladiella britannica]
MGIHSCGNIYQALQSRRPLHWLLHLLPVFAVANVAAHAFAAALVVGSRIFSRDPLLSKRIVRIFQWHQCLAMPCSRILDSLGVRFVGGDLVCNRHRGVRGRGS